MAWVIAAVGCADGASQLEPQTPVSAQVEDPMTVRAPLLEDGFPQVFALATANTPTSSRPPSRSLGYIGDAPLGREPTPPHREPYWARPFPCWWTNTCVVLGWGFAPPAP